MYRPSLLRFRILASTCVLSLIACAQGAAVAATPSIQDGQTVAFMGDSITAVGWGLPYGYIHFVVNGLNAIGIHVTPIPAGISGQTSRDMLARIKSDIISKKPDWMTLSCGVNDVWHGVEGVDLENYKKNISSIVDQCQAAGIHVIILTSTRIGEEDNDMNRKLVSYNDFLRQLAGEKHCLLADLNAAEQAALAKLHADPHQKYLTVDGVHMNVLGNRMMARGILEAIGVDDKLFPKIEQAWLDAPNGGQVEYSLSYRGDIPLTLRESDTLDAIAAARHQSTSDLLNGLFVTSLVKVIKNEMPATQGGIQPAAEKEFAAGVAALLKENASAAAAK
jgi:lysophospholipase L1-like esterase